MIALDRLDVSIARLDRALARATAVPGDPLAVHELVLCLDLLDCHSTPTGLGPPVDDLVGDTCKLAHHCKALLRVEPHRWLSSPATPQEREACDRLRAKLLDLAAAISVVARD